MLGNIISLIFLFIAIVFLRFSGNSPLFHVFHYTPAVNPSFTGNCTIFPSGYYHQHEAATKGFSYDPLASGASSLDIREIAAQLGMRLPNIPHRYDLVNEFGHHVASPAQCQWRHGYLYLLRKRELWTWPTVKVGNELEVDVTGTYGDFTLHKLQTLSTRPRVFLVEDLLKPEEIARIREVVSKERKLEAVEGGNLGSHAWLNGSDDRVFVRLDSRISNILKVPEMLVREVGGYEVVRYGPGEHTPVASDYLTEENEEGSHHINLKRNYFATVAYYVEQAAEGGETCIPLTKEADPECEKGLKIKPKAGSGQSILHSFFFSFLFFLSFLLLSSLFVNFFFFSFVF